MNRYRYLILNITLGLILISCSGQKFTIAPEYLNKKISDGTLLIPTIDKIIIKQDEQLFNDEELNNIEKECFKLLGDLLKNNLKSGSSFREINYVELKTKPNLESQTLILSNGDKIYLNIPTSHIEVKHAGNIYLLFLEDVNLALIKEQTDTSDPAKHYTVAETDDNDVKIQKAKFYNYYLLFQMKYLIYDNANDKVVSYGTSSLKQRYKNQNNTENLLTIAIEKAAKEIISGTPFEK
jgi:hypothetical protein